MNNLTEMFLKLKNCKGTNTKIEFVKTNKDNVEFIESLKFLLDSSIITGINDKKYNKYEMNDVFMQDEHISILTVFDYLKHHNTGKDEDVYKIKKYECNWSSCDEDREVFKSLVTKNLKTGLEVKNCNKAIPNLIPTFDVMLANSYFKLDEKKWNKISNNGMREFNITCKLDGFRCVAIKENGNVKLVSRQGKLYDGCIDIENAIKELPYDNFVLDSEIIISNRKRVPSTLQYKETSNIVTKKDCEKHGVTLNCFDYIDLKEWNSKNGVTSWTERRTKLETVLKDYLVTDDKPLYVVPILYLGNDLNETLNLLGKARENNEEGVMLRFNNSPYEFKRSDELLKFKVMSELDCYIVGYEEGTNKNVGKLGAFYCEINHPQYGMLKFKVGSGYDDSQRLSYWENRDNLVGRVMEVQYFEITENSTTHEKSVRFPVHKCIKEEGQEPNN